jgi:hypothetical protein
MEGGLASAGAPGTDDLLGTNHKHECSVPFTIRSIGDTTLQDQEETGVRM